MQELMIKSEAGEELRFWLVDHGGSEATTAYGLVQSAWRSFQPEPCSVEDWQDDLLEGLQPDGSAELCLGSWHAVAGAEAARLLDWLGTLLDGGSCERPGRRGRLSELAERALVLCPE